LHMIVKARINEGMLVAAWKSGGYCFTSMSVISQLPYFGMFSRDTPVPGGVDLRLIDKDLLRPSDRVQQRWEESLLSMRDLERQGFDMVSDTFQRSHSRGPRECTTSKLDFDVREEERRCLDGEVTTHQTEGA
jgi:hypothetical protein